MCKERHGHWPKQSRGRNVPFLNKAQAAGANRDAPHPRPCLPDSGSADVWVRLAHAVDPLDPIRIGMGLQHRLDVRADGFARVFPEHKYAIFKALQARDGLLIKGGRFVR